MEEKGAVELRGNRHRARVDCDCRFDDRALKLGYAKIVACTRVLATGAVNDKRHCDGAGVIKRILRQA